MDTKGTRDNPDKTLIKGSIDTDGADCTLDSSCLKKSKLIFVKVWN